MEGYDESQPDYWPANHARYHETGVETGSGEIGFMTPMLMLEMI